jgi:probable HAF family extracellular repeat protein
MNKRLGTLFAAVLALAATPALLEAQDHPAKHKHYTFVDIGTFGGPNSNGGMVNDRGTLVGEANTPDWDPICDCPVSHAFQWHDGALTDLGTLPGGTNFSVAISINSRGVSAGVSDNGLIDPMTGIEAFVATAWKNGRITDLGAFGGSFSLANSINDRGQIVGGAEDTVPDPFDFGGQVVFIGVPSPTQWHATLWQNGTMQDLGTLGDGPDSFAYFVNEHGQIAGDSFTDTTPTVFGFPTVHPFLWEHGHMVDLGTLGGVFATSTGLNNRGQVVGRSTIAGDLTNHAFLWDEGTMRDLGTLGGDQSGATALNDRGEVVGEAYPVDGHLHAFLWKCGVMTDLGTVAGDCDSIARSINSKGQIVGESDGCDGSAHAFLWENGGPPIDLNAFVPPGSDLFLLEAFFISDRGEIVGAGVLPNGDEHAFLLTPKEGDQHEAESGIATPTAAPAVQGPSHAALGRPAPERLAALHARLPNRNRGLGSSPPKQAN